jgi:hypothetical protein
VQEFRRCVSGEGDPRLLGRALLVQHSDWGCMYAELEIAAGQGKMTDQVRIS